MAVLQKIDEETKRLLLKLVEQARARGIRLDQKRVVGKAIEYVYERGTEFFDYLTKKKEDRITTFLSPVAGKPGDVVKEHDLIAGE